MKNYQIYNNCPYEHVPNMNFDEYQINNNCNICPPSQNFPPRPFPPQNCFWENNCNNYLLLIVSGIIIGKLLD